MYLMIENKGEANIDYLTLLGASAARGKSDKIGQFGTGFCHGVLTCLRNNINPEIYIGNDELLFSVGKKESTFTRISYMFKGEIEKLSMALEFGSMDWDNVQMGLREFVSNAIDNGEDNQYKVEIVSSKEAKPGYTRVFLPLVSEVNKFFSELPQLFLQFAPNKSDKDIFLNKEGSKGRVYRKGVFVRETQDNALFNYNFGDELKIDECRNLNESTIRQAAGRKLVASDNETITFVLGNISQLPKEGFESKFCSWDLYTYSMKVKQQWVDTFKELYGERAVIVSDLAGPLAEMAQKKGFKLVNVPSLGWYAALESFNIPTALKICAKDVSSDGKKFTKAPTAALIQRVVKIWNKIEKVGLTKGKSFPKIGQFKQVMDGGSVTMGYYDFDTQTIYINEDNLTSKQTILEELAHYITGSTDNSRDFQDFAFALAAAFMK